MRPSLLVLSYLGVSLLVLTAWTYFARTELNADVLDIAWPDGHHYSSKFSSMTRLVDGSALAPFVRRRLLPDLTRVLSAVLPPRCWEVVDGAVHGSGRSAQLLRRVFQRQCWKRDNYSIVFPALFLIWCSVVGFMLACRWLVHCLYETPPWLADVLGGLLGLALLGGQGDWHYCGYPYDFPNAFVFTLALTALIAGRWWFPLAFAVAAYSKETAVLLIFAHILLAPERRSRSFWRRLALLVVLYGGIRAWIQLQYQAPSGPFWFPLRNLRWLVLQAFFLWFLPLALVALVRFAAHWRDYPMPLRRLALLLIPLVGMAFFKGWIEEMRQYLELLPVFGLMALQCLLCELGRGDLLRARPWPAVSSSSPESFAASVALPR